MAQASRKDETENMIKPHNKKYTAATGQAAIEEFEAKHSMGTPVRFYPVAGEPEFEIGNIRSECWLLGHHQPVVKITGRAGCVSIDHIEPVQAGDLEPKATQ